MEIECKDGYDKRVTHVTFEILFELVFLNQGKKIKSFLKNGEKKKITCLTICELQFFWEDLDLFGQ